MEQTSVKNQNLRGVFAIVLIVLLVAYVVAMALPMITYTHTTGDLAGQDEKISLMTFLWKPYAHPDLTGTQVLNNYFSTELHENFRTPINQTIAGPLYAFLGAFISILAVALGRNKAFNVYFPFAWALISIILYLINPLLKLSIIDSSIVLIHYIIFGLTLVVSVVDFFVVFLPQIRHDKANKEIY